MLIQFNAKYKVGDLVFDNAGNRLSIHSIRYDVLAVSSKVYYYTRNVDVNSTEYNAYAWFTENCLTPINPKQLVSPELPF